MSQFDRFGGGGGFMDGNVTSSPVTGGQNQGGKKVFKAQNCVPVTIRQILESTEDNFKIGRTDVHLVTIVGLLINKELDSTKSSYLFDDYTGRVSAHVFTYNDSGVSNETNCEIGQYHRVYGSVRMTDGKHHIMAFKVQPLENLNELTTHLLEVMYVPLSLEEHDRDEAAASTVQTLNDGGDFRTSMMYAGTNMGNDTMFGGTNTHTNMKLNPQQQMVYNLIKAVKTESGLDTSTIPTNQVSRKDLASTLEYLTGEGHIYSTIDDQHYKTTDI